MYTSNPFSFFFSTNEQITDIKELCRQRLLHVAQSIENCRTMNIQYEIEDILTILLELSSFAPVDDSLILVEEALLSFNHTRDVPEDDPVPGAEPCTGVRRKYAIPSETLEMLIESGLKVNDIAQFLNVSKRTVERRMNEYNLTIRQMYSEISNEELRTEVSNLCHEYPHVGYRTIKSLLQSKGLRIQERKVRAAVRECDPCGVLFRTVFLSSRIQRRVYSVQGPQALWHIDGNHKLIRYALKECCCSLPVQVHGHT